MTACAAVAAAGIAGLFAPAAARAGETRFSEQAVLAWPAPGKHIRFGRYEAESGGFSAKDRLVATYYFYWYDDESGRHFRNPDGSDGQTDHPADAKGYSYRLASWHRKQLADMAAAGIDVVLPVFWGCPGNTMAGNAGEHWSYAGLPPLVQASEELRAAGGNPPRVGMFYDTSTLQHNAAGHRVDLSTPDGRAWFYVTIRDFFSLIPSKLWATVDGKPIVFLYSAGFAAGGTADTQLVGYVRSHFAEDFGGARPYLVAERSWKIGADSTYAWGGAEGLQVLGVAALGPGYDDHVVPGRTGPRTDREGGAFYQRNWERLLAMDPGRRPGIVAVETWNEWHEGTDIAESREYGRRYIDLTRSYAAAWKAGERRKLGGPYADAREVSITFGPDGKSAGLQLKAGGDGQAGVTRAGGADCLQTLPNSAGSHKYIYFDVDESFYFDSGIAVEAVVEYLDEGTGWFGLQYDSADPSAPLAGAYKDAATVKRTGSGAWKTATFVLADARLVNRENLSSDLRLSTPTDLKVRRVAVSKRPSAVEGTPGGARTTP